MATLAGSLRNLFAEIDDVWPNRDRRTDGWIGDSSHQQRQSDHNPDSRGIVHAIDIDKDGIEPMLVVEACISDDRPTSYVVYNRTIWSRTRDFRPRAYTGSNPHTSHIHVSILYGTHWESSDWGWGIAGKATGSASRSSLGPTDDLIDFNYAFRDVGDAFYGNGTAMEHAANTMNSLMG